MIVGMNRLLRADLAAQHLDGAVRDHFVRVHVGLRAGTGLPHDERKMFVEFALGYFLRRTRDGSAALRIEYAEGHVDARGGAFDEAEGTDHRHRHAFAAYAKIPSRALGLRAPVPVGGNFDRAEGIGFHAHSFSAGLAFGGGTHFLRKESRLTTSAGAAAGFSAGNSCVLPPATLGRFLCAGFSS